MFPILVSTLESKGGVKCENPGSTCTALPVQVVQVGQRVAGAQDELESNICNQFIIFQQFQAISVQGQLGVDLGSTWGEPAPPYRVMGAQLARAQRAGGLVQPRVLCPVHAHHPSPQGRSTPPPLVTCST